MNTQRLTPEQIHEARAQWEQLSSEERQAVRVFVQMLDEAKDRPVAPNLLASALLKAGKP
jgi:hypothetical protein